MNYLFLIRTRRLSPDRIRFDGHKSTFKRRTGARNDGGGETCSRPIRILETILLLLSARTVFGRRGETKIAFLYEVRRETRQTRRDPKALLMT